MEQKTFRAAPGARFDDQKAQVYGEFIDRLSEEKGRTVTTDEVLDAARPAGSPLHDFFCWDDEAAAEAFRKSQARNLINRIEVIIISPNGEERAMKAFHNIVIEDDDRGDQRVYVAADVVAHDEYFRSRVIENALKEIRRWQEKYREYKELDIIFGAIEKVQQKLNFDSPQPSDQPRG